MPYITKKDREMYEDEINALVNKLDNAHETALAGHLNYVISMLLKRSYPEKCRYRDYNEQVGVLESAKLELYRRRVAIYEDEKIDSEGDVY